MQDLTNLEMIVSALDFYKASRETPLTKDDLMELLHTDKRQVGLLITALRQSGVRVCSLRGTAGYWLANNQEDYSASREERIHRVREMARIIIAMDQGSPATDAQVDAHVHFDDLQ